MLFMLLVTGVILGLMIKLAMKTLSKSYGFSNDQFNKPVIIKTCLYCNSRIPKSYTKNLCPTCNKPLE